MTLALKMADAGYDGYEVWSVGNHSLREWSV